MSSLCNFLNNLISARCIMLEVSHQNPTTHPKIPNTKSSYPFIPRWIQGEPRVFISGTEIKEEAEINSNVWTLSLYLWHTRLEYHTEYHLSIKTKELFHKIRDRRALVARYDDYWLGWLWSNLAKYNRQDRKHSWTIGQV